MDWIPEARFPSLLARLGWKSESIRAYADPQYTHSDDMPEFASLFELPPENVCKFGDVVLVADDGFHPVCKIRVSSCVLASSSEVFRALFFGNFAEAKARRVNHPGPTEITVQDDPRHLLVLCQMLHHNADSWLTSQPWCRGNLLDVAVLIDKYGLAESLKTFIYGKLAWHHEHLISDYGLVELVTVAYLLDQNEHFRKLTQKLVLGSMLYRIEPRYAEILPERLIDSLKLQQAFLRGLLARDIGLLTSQYEEAAFSSGKPNHYPALTEQLREYGLGYHEIRQRGLDELLAGVTKIELPRLEADSYPPRHGSIDPNHMSRPPTPHERGFSAVWNLEEIVVLTGAPPNREDVVNIAKRVSDHCVGVCLDCLRDRKCEVAHRKPWLKFYGGTLSEHETGHFGGETLRPLEWADLW